MKSLNAWYCDAWRPTHECGLPLDDLGLMQGAVIVDRLRTVRGTALDADAHVERFLTNCHCIGIANMPDADQLRSTLEQCLVQNRFFFEVQDGSIVLLATPGSLHSRLPTWIVQPTAIPWKRMQNHYASGQKLTIAQGTAAIPSACWSPAIKTRARLNYFLADHEAEQRFPNSYANGIVCDQAGCLTETSTANLLIVEQGGLVSPPKSDILPGVSLARTLRLASNQGINVRFEPIDTERALQAEAVLLCGSLGCLWPTAQIDNRRFEQPTVHAIYRELSHAWMQDIEFDFVAQANHNGQLSG